MRGNKSNRHAQKRADGGSVLDANPSPSSVYAGKGSKVVEEADQKKKGGAVCAKKDGGKVEGGVSRLRLDRPGRKMGGRVGCDGAPMSSASRTTNPAGHVGDESSDGDKNPASAKAVRT